VSKTQSHKMTSRLLPSSSTWVRHQERPHGNSKCEGISYIRMPRHTMDNTAKQVTTTSTKVVYDDMITLHKVEDAPHNMRVVSN